MKTIKFIEKAKLIHNNTYDYSLVEYKNNKIKIKIICPKHGIFEQRPDAHILGQGCSKCKNNFKYTKETFVEKANKIHNNIYDYSLVNFINIKTKIKIICPEHGIFEQSPDKHLYGCDCQKCKNNFKYTKETFVEKANKVHNNTYDYSLVEYKNNKIKIKIICLKHGIFDQLPDSHLYGSGCSICGGTNNLTKNEFINRVNKIHNNKYDYSLVNYKTMYKKIKIICPKHGIFEQYANNHIQNKGCPYCNESKGEREIVKILKEKNINFKRQFIFQDCRNKNPLPFDFYLPEYNICIEYDGKQHYEAVKHWGGKAGFQKRLLNDNIKTKYCIENNIKLIRIKYNQNLFENIIF